MPTVAPSPTPYQSGGAPSGFYWQFDNHGGINYFGPGNQPINNYQYAQATGQDTGQLESQAKAQYNPGDGGQYGPFQNQSNIFSSIPQAQTGQSTGGDNGIKIYGNQQYDLNDPAQREAYYQAVQSNLQAQRDAALQQAQQAFQSGDSQTVNQYQQYLSQLDQNMSDVNAQAQQYATNYFQTVGNFNEQKGQGDVNRQGYYASISPNAFQSSQATSQDYANGKYLQGLGDLANQGQQTVGLDYLNAFDPKSLQSTGQFDPNSQFGRDITGLNTQRGGLENSFNTYRTGAQTNYQNQQNSIYDKYNAGLASQAESLGQIDLSQGTNPFQYGVQTVSPYHAPNVDLSQYTPYTNFQSLSNPNQQGSSYQAPKGSTNAFSQNSLDSWLGRTNTQLPASQKNDWFTKYLSGKVTT